MRLLPRMRRVRQQSRVLSNGKRQHKVRQARSKEGDNIVGSACFFALCSGSNHLLCFQRACMLEALPIRHSACPAFRLERRRARK